MVLDREGERYGKFLVTKCLDIPELRCVLRECLHEPTQAQIIHIENDDPENVFSLSFRTLPNSSNGVAHILEHTVLCGSEKYPIKDPFFSMNRRSLNTYMNALTGSDFTCYPAASQVPKDFYNLLGVYLDAVFHPLLKELSFRQEGHRLEFEDPLNPASQLQFKGIVFNEMKGFLTNPETRLWQRIMESLYPDLTYCYNSGGDPAIIPSLTYKEFLEFHQQYYHPSRCYYYFYGNLPLIGHLDFLERELLSKVKGSIPHLPAIPKQKVFFKPQYYQISYSITETDYAVDKCYIALAWNTLPISKMEELLALYIVEIMLLGTDAGLLKVAIIESGLCKQVSVFLDGEMSEVPFILILKGCKEKDADALEKLVTDTLKKIATTEIPQELIDAAIHQLEFHRGEITGDHYPFGLVLFLRSVLIKQQGGKLEDGLRFRSIFKSLREKCRGGEYLKQLIHELLLNNRHFVRITMEPDVELSKKEKDEEERSLQKIREQLTKEDEQQLVKQAEVLQAYQNRSEDDHIDVLPKVSLDDVSRNPKNYPLKVKDKVFFHDCFTNGIVYLDWAFPLPYIPEKDLSLLSLFVHYLTQMGCGGRDYKSHLKHVQAYTGGIGASLSLYRNVQDPENFSPCLTLRGKALERNMDKLCILLKDVLTSVEFNDKERVKAVLLRHYTVLSQALSQVALKYAVNLGASYLGPSMRLMNYWSGLEYFSFIRKLVEKPEKSASKLCLDFERLKTSILGKSGGDWVVSADAAAYDQMTANGFWGLTDLPSKKEKPWKSPEPVSMSQSQGRVIASPVAFTCKVLKSLPYVHVDTTVLNVLSHICDNKVLHKRIREQGGAYGGGSANIPMGGYFYFYSYRDPNLTKTLAAFEEALEQIRAGNFNEQDIEEAKLGVLQGLDAPITPGERAWSSYTWFRECKDMNIRSQQRQRLLNVKKEDIIAAVEKHLIPKFALAPVVSFSARELLEKENEILKSQGSEQLIIQEI